MWMHKSIRAFLTVTKDPIMLAHEDKTQVKQSWNFRISVVDVLDKIPYADPDLREMLRQIHVNGAIG
ncbi:unnamed protein product [Clonostachys rhizophaga]|uniref:Uncharacterized protein n=1 Tax=Clonostachys rhizophaga TaxID=160324 RepID=A0A9N9YS09_9HYPO|nr:unnamed protein product [Clonostachys rhizophaga]